MQKKFKFIVTWPYIVVKKHKTNHIKSNKKMIMKKEKDIEPNLILHPKEQSKI